MFVSHMVMEDIVDMVDRADMVLDKEIKFIFLNVPAYCVYHMGSQWSMPLRARNG